MERINVVLEMDNLEAEIKELKLDLFGDTLSKYNMITEDDYTILEFKDDEKITSGKTLLYGRVIQDKLYLARLQYIASISIDEPDFYEQFFCTGKELLFN